MLLSLLDGLRREYLQSHLAGDHLVPKRSLAGLRVILDSPLTSQAPSHVDDQTQRVYDLLPSIKISDLLVEVDRWTNFTRHFTTLRHSTPPRDHEALFAALLAEATNLGTAKMAMATPGVS